MYRKKSYFWQIIIVGLLLLLPCVVSLSIPNPPTAIQFKRFQENRARTEIREAATNGLISALRQAQNVINEKKIGEIEPVLQNVQSHYEKWQANTAQEREWILRTGLPVVALERHDNATAQLDAKLQSLMQTLEQLRDSAKAGPVGALQGKPFTDAQRIFADLIQDPKELELKNPTPFRASPNEKVFTKQARPQLAASSSSIPIPLTTTDSPTPGDLQETEEVQFTTAITNLATSLNNDALEIFQYVQNQIDFIPYYGSKKGADNTLLEKAGNDADVASLLIALLRVSNIPSRYVEGKIQLTPQQTMEWLGVNDPWTAVQVIANGLIPHEVFVDASDPTTIVFVQMEHIWVEAYVPYGNYRGLGGDQSNKIWVPLDPSWKKYFYTQNVNIPDDMGFDIDAFYNNYLSGVQADTPLTTYRNQLTSYLSTAYPNLSYNDILTRQYRLEETFDFLPNTLPYEVVEISDTPSALPTELRHQLRIKIADDQTTFLDTTLEVLDVANQQVVLSAVAATTDDQTIIDAHGGIYQTPPDQVNLKPVVRINGQEITSGSAYGMGLAKTLSLDFLMPKKVNGVLNLVEKEHVEKNTILGNDEGIAINTDRIVLPELREQTPSTEFVNGQKLYRSALNYLEGLESSQEEIGKTFGATFTNTATRAIVFNGIDVVMVDGIPQTFTWKGLRIDASANIRYHSHFGDVDSHKKEFLMIWGLDGSFAEATLFEDDYAIEAMSTVKGLTLINEGTISGVTVQTISSGNQADIENLNVSENTKVVFRDAVNQGKIVYTPDQQFTYLNWTGLVYIVLDPVVGDGGYIIGEGLNGGYTVADWLDNWVYLWQTRIVSTIEAIINLSKPIYTLGEKIIYDIVYKLFLEGNPDPIVEFTEEAEVDSEELGEGIHEIESGYGTDAQVVVEVKEKPNPLNIKWADNGGVPFNHRSRAGESIEMIVMHYTLGGSASSARNALGSRGLSSHYVIETDGTIYQLVKDEFSAFHAGIKNDLVRDRIIKANDRGIGIEIVNWGWLTREGDNYKTHYGSPYDPDVWGEPIQTPPWQPNPGLLAYEYWHPYTEKQYEKLKALIDELSTRHGIQKITFAPSPIIYVVDPYDLENFNGVIGHSAISEQKWDPGPHLDWDRLLK